MSSVYVIAAEGGPVKIGMAKDPAARMKMLGTGTPFPLRLAHVMSARELNARRVEAAAHALLSAARTHGEWFSVTVDEARDAVLRAIKEIHGDMSVEEASSGGSCTITIRFPGDLKRWLAERAQRNGTTQTHEIEVILRAAMERETGRF